MTQRYTQTRLSTHRQRQLRTRPTRRWAISRVCQHLNLDPNNDEDWNRAIDYLDSVNPEWRGYTINQQQEDVAA